MIIVNLKLKPNASQRTKNLVIMHGTWVSKHNREGFIFHGSYKDEILVESITSSYKDSCFIWLPRGEIEIEFEKIH